ncbi:MAG: YabP/YqfC family sporulation protein [Christensenellaceae bacterium]
MTIEQQKSITVTGIESVASFSESQIALSLAENVKLYVTGSGLKITGFSRQAVRLPPRGA